MRSGRGFIVHVALLALAGAFAGYVWTREKAPKALAQADVVVWSGKAADVESVGYETKTKKVTLEAKKDGAGTFYIGTVDKEQKPLGKPKDAGADADADAAEPAPARTKVTFVSVGAAQKLADGLAPMKALRGLGKIADDRAAEFGFEEPEGTITVRVGGTERKLVVGATTPGGADRYTKDGVTGEVFVIKGDIVRDLDSAESKLLERDLHEWKEPDIAGAKVLAAGKSRSVVRGGSEGKKFWADPSTKDQNDETVSNWMTKLDWLKPSEYALTPPPGAESVVRVEYTGPGNKPLGFVEVWKSPGEGDKKPDYWVLSERTRYHGKVTTSFGEQTEQDVGSVLK